LIRYRILSVLLAIVVAACAGRDGQRAAQPPAATVSLMTFNVENLFDTRDDAGKDDRTFLPLSAKETDEHRQACSELENEYWRDQCLHWDWNEQILHLKLAAVAGSILQVGNGRGPDILALQEVENLGILERLRTEYLGAAGYAPAILIEGNDTRGIDVAFLTRLEVVGKPVLHTIPFEGAPAKRIADTRGILEATFRLPGGALLTGYAVHFPAPYHPTEMRVAAYRLLNELRSSLPADRAAFAAGDFNTTSREDREKSMLERYARTHWTAVHEQGDPGAKGTSYYPPDDSWSFLDMILWSPARSRGDASWSLREDSVQIPNRFPAQVLDGGIPARFELPAGSGVSDHWPLLVVVELKTTRATR
jgi:endonuclease/exonuclease/phosphatase family metal-dependent hydrolase